MGITFFVTYFAYITYFTYHIPILDYYIFYHLMLGELYYVIILMSCKRAALRY